MHHTIAFVYLYISLLVAMHGTYFDKECSVHSSLPKINVRLSKLIYADWAPLIFPYVSSVFPTRCGGEFFIAEL